MIDAQLLDRRIAMCRSDMRSDPIERGELLFQSGKNS